MARVHKTQAFDISADEMWVLIGDFHGVHKWVAGMPVSEPLEGGALRRVPMGSGFIVERLLAEGDRSYTYAVEEGAVSLSDYRSTLSVREAAGGGCIVDWLGEFAPGDGADEQGAVRLVDMLYSTGLAGLEKRLSSTLSPTPVNEV
ncbi:MAG: SRPBCC family protein [Acidimicrobiales bacterium]